MGKGTTYTRLGISLGGEALQIAEMQHAGDRVELLGLTVVPLDSPFSHRTISNEVAQQDIATLLRQALDDAGMNATQAVFSIDSTMALVHRLPYDASLKPKEVTQHIPWELEQYLLSPLEDYAFDFQPFQRHDHETAPHFIMVAVKKPIIETVRHIAELAELTLAIVDVDMLAAVNAFEMNYSISAGEYSALVEAGENKLHFSFLNGHTFLDHLTVHLEPGADDSASLAKEITRQLRFYASDYLSDDGGGKFDHIFLYKPAGEHDLAGILSESGITGGEMLNPLASLPVADEMAAVIASGDDFSHFTEAIGLALRK